jgi:hypothetical protein
LRLYCMTCTPLYHPYYLNTSVPQIVFTPGAVLLRFRPPFPLPLSAEALSLVTRFARATSRSSHSITFALPRTRDLVDRRTLASLFISDRLRYLFQTKIGSAPGGEHIQQRTFVRRLRASARAFECGAYLARRPKGILFYKIVQ